MVPGRAEGGRNQGGADWAWRFKVELEGRGRTDQGRVGEPEVQGGSEVLRGASKGGSERL